MAKPSYSYKLFCHYLTKKTLFHPSRWCSFWLCFIGYGYIFKLSFFYSSMLYNCIFLLIVHKSIFRCHTVCWWMVFQRPGVWMKQNHFLMKWRKRVLNLVSSFSEIFVYSYCVTGGNGCSKLFSRRLPIVFLWEAYNFCFLLQMDMPIVSWLLHSADLSFLKRQSC